MYRMGERAQGLFRRVSPAYRTKRKHDAELAYWQGGLRNLEDWFLKGANLRIGLRPPTPEQKLNTSESWIVNAVTTLHALRPHYTERLGIERDHFHGQRVLEIGCGPLAPILQFSNCARHCVDPLVDVYMTAGWPLYDYDAKFINTGGESLPYRDGYFDAVISVNSLDHVDDFEQTASEMERVVRRGGSIYFEVEYHQPTVTEPVKLDDARVLSAFSQCELTAVTNRSGKELYEALVKRFDLLPFDFQHFDGQFCTWRAARK
jgi:ubiquinone/menaquinone biosynthesis C-methylase UbiE